jgi:uncharacterized phage protein gp47/JayE
MAINTKDFATLVSDQVTAMQASCKKLVNFAEGSVLRALADANAAVALWFQGLLLKLLAMTRAATSMASDLDSWMADYGVTRILALFANGNVTFARFTPTMQALIPFGSVVQTTDGGQQFIVVESSTHPAYTPTGYVIPAGVASVTVPVQALVAGAAGNVSIGQITVITQGITYIDTVTNEAAFVNGADAETDEQLRSRFVLYIASLARATINAIGFAITSVKAGTTYRLVENEQYNGTVDNGYFYVVVDDGTGTPTADFLSSISNAIDAVRGASIRFGVFAPVIVNATVTMTVTVAAGYDPVATKELAKNAITNHINSLPLGESLEYSRLMQLAYNASPGITNVKDVVLNGGNADLIASDKQVIKASSVTVS